MKRLVTIFFLSVWALAAFAQGGGISLLDRVEGHRVTFHYTYSLSQQGSAFSPVTDGDVTVEGNAYILEGLGLKVVSNGITRWTVDESAKELLIEKVEQEDLFTNPALFIGSYKRYMDRIRVNAQGPDSLDVTLTLDESTQARFQLQHISYGVLQGKSDFSYDEKSLSSDYVITDLR